MASSTIPDRALGPGALRPVEEPEALRAPTRAVGLGFQLSLCAVNVVMWLGLPIGQIVLARQVEGIDPAHKVSSYGLVTAVGALVALVVTPLAGALSDRTTSRFGRRRPWILGCALGSAGALTLLAHSATIGILVAAWALGQVPGNGMGAAVAAVVPDRIPVRQRATASAIIGLSQPLAIVGGSVLFSYVLKGVAAPYAFNAIALVLVAALFVLALRDAPLPAEAVAPLHLGAFLKGFWISPRAYPDFAWAWLTRFLVILGYALTTGYLLYFLEDAVHYTRLFPRGTAEQGVATLQLISVGALLVSSVATGVLSDRLGRRKVFVMGSSATIAVALLLLSFVQTWPAVELAAAIVGLGFGAYIAVDLALITQVLPSAGARAKDLGIINIANATPYVLAPALSALVVGTTHSYTPLFLSAAVVTLLGAALVRPIKGVR